MEPDKVTIKNVGDTTVTIGDVEIEAGKEAEVDRDLAVSQLGSHGGDSAELTRVQTIWGFYAGFRPDDEWAEVAPSVEVYDSDGNRVWTLTDDPTEKAAAEEGKPRKAAKPADKAPDKPADKAATKK